jgi:UDP-N-acetylglucosamine 1-carboxyvinyltransferase
LDALIIEGGRRLSGHIAIEGAKNSALPACVAALLTDEPIILRRVPQLRDVSTILYTLGALGKRVVRNEGGVVISGDGPLSGEANPYSVRKMRASFLVLGPLVARLGRARVPLPGGCVIGARPVDLHLRGLETLGAHIEEHDGVVDVSADRLRGARIELGFPSVGATEHLMMTATLADGVTEIANAAVEPEVLDLVELLRSMGAEIAG